MTEHADASARPRRRRLRARIRRPHTRSGSPSGPISVAAGAFLLHQLMAWPPHEDETLALFVGRDSLAGVVEHVTRERGGAPLHFLFAWAVAHLGFGLGGMRIVSAAFAVASLPLVALLGRRLADRRTALVATALVAAAGCSSSTASTRGCTASSCSSRSLSFLLLFAPSTVGAWRPGGPGEPPSCSRCRRTRTARWSSPSQAVFVLAAAARSAEAAVAFVVVGVAGIPFWLTDLVLANRFDVGVGGGGSKLGGPVGVVTYLWRTAGDFSTGRWPCSRSSSCIGARRARRRPARDPACSLRDRRSRGGVPRGAPRRLDLAGIAASDLRAAVLRIVVGAGSSAARGALRRPRSRSPPCWSSSRSAGPGMHAAALRRRAGKRQATRAQARGSLRRRAGRTTSCSATSRSTSGVGAGPRLLRRRHPAGRPGACARTSRGSPEPLGRGVWVLDASDTNNLQRRLRSNRDPGPAGAFEARAFGPFLVIRTREPVGDASALPRCRGGAMLVGRSLGIGDADINLRTIDAPIECCAATGRRCASLSTPRGSKARSRRRRARLASAPSACGGRSRRRRRPPRRRAALR